MTILEGATRRGLLALGGICVLVAGCASGPDQRDTQEGVLFLNPETDVAKHIVDIDACNLARDAENPTGEQVGVAAAGLLLGGLPGLIAIAMINDEKEAGLYNQCMIGKGYEPVALDDQYLGVVQEDNGQDEVKEAVTALHAALSDEERSAWTNARTEASAEAYQNYLETFPQGIFSKEANLRISKASFAQPQKVVEQVAQDEESANKVWQLRAEITESNYDGKVAFCKTGMALQGQLIESGGQLEGSIQDAAGNEYPLRGAIEGNVLRLTQSKDTVWTGEVKDGSVDGRISKSYNVDAISSDWWYCNGQFTLS